MRRRKRIIVERMVSRAKHDSFDIDFWQRSGAQSRFIAAWKMIEELYKMKGKRGYKFRLQRSVQNIEQV